MDERMPMLQGVGHVRACVRIAALGPALAAALAWLGVCGIVLAESGTAFGRAMGAFGRVFAVALIAVCAAAGLFGHLIASSDIPAAVEHYQRTAAVRDVTHPQRETLFYELRKIADSIPSFPVLAGRDPGSIEYADDLIDALLAAGLKLDNGTRPDAKANVTDIRSTANRGLMIAVKDPNAPPRGATLLGNALKSARIPFMYIRLTGETGDNFLMLVGPA